MVPVRGHDLIFPSTETLLELIYKTSNDGRVLRAHAGAERLLGFTEFAYPACSCNRWHPVLP